MDGFLLSELPSPHPNLLTQQSPTGHLRTSSATALNCFQPRKNLLSPLTSDSPESHVPQGSVSWLASALPSGRNSHFVPNYEPNPERHFSNGGASGISHQTGIFQEGIRGSPPSRPCFGLCSVLLTQAAAPGATWL